MSMMIQSGRFASAAPVIGTYIDPAQLTGPGGANISLSNANLTATKSASNSIAHAIAKHGKITGKWRFQVTVDVMPMAGGELGIGVVGPVFNRNTYQGGDNQGGGFVSDGRQGTNGGYGASGLAAWVVGAVLDVYVDADAKKVWFGRNGVISGDPTAGTGGVSLASAVRAFYPNLYMHGGNGVLTANFSGPFTHALHPAYGAWSATTTVTKANARGFLIYSKGPAIYFGHTIGEIGLRAVSGGTNWLTGGTAVAQGNDGNVPGNVVDGNPLTFWSYSPGGGANQVPSWIYAYAAAPGDAQYFVIQARAGAGGEQLQAPTLTDLYLSADGTNYEKVLLNYDWGAWTPGTPGQLKELAIPAF